MDITDEEHLQQLTAELTALKVVVSCLLAGSPPELRAAIIPALEGATSLLSSAAVEEKLAEVLEHYRQLCQ